MKINVFVKPNKKKEYVEQVDLFHFTVSVKAPAKDGRANQAVLELLAKHFNITPNKIVLLSGHTNQHKTFGVSDLTEIDTNKLQNKLF